MKAKKTASPGSKKPAFEDGVRFALIAGVIVCALVLGAAAFFALRSFWGDDFSPPSAGILEGDENAQGNLPPEIEDEGSLPDPLTDTEDSGEDLLPELEDAIRRLSAEPAERSGISEADETSGLPVRVPEPQPILPPERKGILVFVIDDAGNNLKELEPFLTVPGPLTIAVLPGLPFSAEAAKRIRAAKKELFLHQPMEPLNGSLNPGPGAIKTGMSAGEIRAIVNKNLEEIWPVAGINNHEGSKATADSALMKTLLELCRDRRIHFLDSKTITASAAPAAALDTGITIAQRDIFLDNEQDREAILASIEEGCRRAEKNGFAVMIGHVWSPGLAGLLAEQYPRLQKQGFYLAAVSALLDAGK